MLRRWLHRPLRDRDTLRARYHAVATLIEASRHTALAELLRGVGDLERILARIALRSARPRDLAQLRTALGALPGAAGVARGRAKRDPVSAPRAAARRIQRSPRSACAARARDRRIAAALFARRRRDRAGLRQRTR